MALVNSEPMITDNDIKKLKQEFKKDFATKDDLKAYATKNDVDNALEKQTEKIESMLLDFRGDIFDKLDRNVGGLAKVEDEQEIVASRLSDHDDRIEVIETKLAISP